MATRVTIFITQRNSGWSENWYTDETVANAINDAEVHCSFRRALLANAATIIGVRASSVDPPGTSLVKTISLAGTAGILADNSYQSLLLTVRGGLGLKRSFLLRGLPDARNEQGVYVPSLQYNADLVAYFGNVVNNGFSLRTINRNNELIPVQNVSNSGVLTVVGTPAWTTGDKLKFYRKRTVAGRLLSQPYIIAAPVATSQWQLAGWPAGDLVAGGYIRKLQYVLTDVSNIDNTGRTLSRRVGRPFGQPVGRRKSRC